MIEDILKTESALEDLGITKQIKEKETGQTVHVISGVRSINGNQPDDQGDISIDVIENDPIFSASEAASFVAGDKSKLDSLTQYTDEQAQDAIGNAVGNGLDYDDTSGAISVDETELTTFLKLDQTTPQEITGSLLLGEISTPATPAANKGKFYVKDDSGTTRIFLLDSGGIETDLTGGGGGATTLPALLDVDDALAYTAGFVLRADGAQYTGAQLAHADLSNVGTNTHAQIDTHLASTANPHSVTAAQVSALPTSYLDTDIALTANSDTKIASQKATKAYSDALLTGQPPKTACRVATITAGTLATDFENGDTVDGVVLATGDRLLIKDQADATENGIYVVQASGAPTRATDYDASSEVGSGTNTFITDGSAANKYYLFAQITPNPTLGSSDLIFTPIGKQTTNTASLGVELVGADFRLDLLATGALTLTGNEVGVNVDDSSIEIATNALQVKALGITNAMLAGSIADSKLSQITTASKVDGAAITGLASLPAAAGVVPIANLATGSPDGSKFIRDDGTLQTPAGGGSSSSTIYMPLHWVEMSSVALNGGIWTNMPAAETVFMSVTTKGIRKFDASLATQYRIVVWQTVAGTSGADIRLQYSLDGSTSWTNADAAGTELDVGTGTGLKSTALVDLAAGAKAFVWFRLLGKQGNGSTDPAWSEVKVEFKIPGGDTLLAAPILVTSAQDSMSAEVVVDADLATFSLPANTTITAAAATILDDVSVAAINTTLGLGTTDGPTHDHLHITNNATAATLTATAAGGLELGTDAATNVAGYIKMFSAGANAFYNTFTSGTNTANATYTLPTAMPASNKVLQSTSAGVLTWETVAAGLADGDYGDITVGGTGTTMAIDVEAVTYAKMQHVSATDKLLGRSTAGAGDVEEIACTAAGRALLDDAAASNQVATLGFTATVAEVNTSIDGCTAGFAELNLIDGSVAGTIVNSKAVIYSAAGQVNATTFAIAGTAITSSAAELNLCDGQTATAAEVNLIDGSVANTVVNSKAVIYGAAGQITGANITATTAFLADADNGADLGSTSYAFDNAYVDEIVEGETWETSVKLGGSMAVDTNFMNGAVIVPYTVTLTKIMAHAETAPTGATMIIDVHYATTGQGYADSATIMTGTKVVIPNGSRDIQQTTFSTSALAQYSLLYVDVDQIGSTIGGGDVTIKFVGKKIGAR